MKEIIRFVFNFQDEDDSGPRSRIWGLLRSVTTSSPQGESIAALKTEVAALEVSSV